MNAEHIKFRIEMALALLQVLSEDTEENFVASGLNNAIIARGKITLSSLYILSDYLSSIKNELDKEGV